MTATPGISQISPTGKLKLRVREFGGQRIPYQSFDIIDQTSGKIMYSCPDSFFMRHTTYFLWDDHVDRTWVYSGDVGTSYWEQDSLSPDWIKHGFIHSPPRPPQFLINYWPKMFQ